MTGDPDIESDAVATFAGDGFAGEQPERPMLPNGRCLWAAACGRNAFTRSESGRHQAHWPHA